MPGIELTRVIKAPAARVFDVVAHLDVFAQAIPTITAASCISADERGVGCQWRVQRRLGGKERSTVFEVLEYEPDEWVRIVSEAGGATWDAGFELLAQNKTTELTWTLDAKANSLKARLGLPLIMGAVETALAPDMDAIKSFCESGS